GRLPDSKRRPRIAAWAAPGLGWCGTPMKVTGDWKGEASWREFIWRSWKQTGWRGNGGVRQIGLRERRRIGSRGDQVGVAVEHLGVVFGVPLGIHGDLLCEVLRVPGIARLQFLGHHRGCLRVDRSVAEALEECDLALRVLGRGYEVPDRGAGGVHLRDEPSTREEDALVEV